ncbi:hypothetical protein P154DRAFT_581002 [Amniculicola lignicola CBS 123094]|uniref:Uncharacterized protein n=1 Tax=Amniculicola lignicola CBS 123094 TaxID=1392246 RepID=A0A6A5W2K9_9PLEO|nr:hypothetical protein P154DRAFT_581002 [Amniculicola lignicola CBS 123094]
MVPPRYYPYAFLKDLHGIHLDTPMYRQHQCWLAEEYPIPTRVPLLFRIHNLPDWYRRNYIFLEYLKGKRWKLWKEFRKVHRDVHDEIYTEGLMQNYNHGNRFPDNLDSHLHMDIRRLTTDLNFTPMHYRCFPRIGNPKFDIQIHRIPLPSKYEDRTSGSGLIIYNIPYEEEYRQGWVLNVDQPRYNYVVYLLWRAACPTQHKRVTLDNFTMVSTYIRRHVIMVLLNDDNLRIWLEGRGERMIVEEAGDEEEEEKNGWSGDDDAAIEQLHPRDISPFPTILPESSHLDNTTPPPRTAEHHISFYIMVLNQHDSSELSISRPFLNDLILLLSEQEEFEEELAQITDHTLSAPNTSFANPALDSRSMYALVRSDFQKVLKETLERLRSDQRSTYDGLVGKWPEAEELRKLPLLEYW